MPSVLSPLQANAPLLEALLASIPEPFFILDEDGRYVDIIESVDRRRYHEARHLVGKRMHEVMDAALADRFLAQVRRAIETGQVLNYSYTLSSKDIKGSEALPGPEGELWFEARISPIRAIEGEPRMVVWVAFNVTELKRTIQEKDALIERHAQAIQEIKTLRGILPVCSFCKKVRDDKGYWTQLESYLRAHSDADISHGLCPDCARKNYPGHYRE